MFPKGSGRKRAAESRCGVPENRIEGIYGRGKL